MSRVLKLCKILFTVPIEIVFLLASSEFIFVVESNLIKFHNRCERKKNILSSNNITIYLRFFSQVKQKDIMNIFISETIAG